MNKNKILHNTTISISLFLIIIACIWDNKVFTILSGIGCSGLAAAVTAIFLEKISSDNELKKVQQNRTIYLSSLQDQLKMLIERTLWFDDRMSEDFDWKKDSGYYSTFKYMLSVAQTYPEQKLTLEEVEKRFNHMKVKYSLDSQSKMTSEELEKTIKMFNILGVSAIHLMNDVKRIQDNMINLNIANIISLSDSKNLCFDISVAINLMLLPNKNYAISLNYILNIYKQICSLCNTYPELTVSLHGSIFFSEL